VAPFLVDFDAQSILLVLGKIKVFEASRILSHERALL
jgi:hypothetical protein